MDSELDHTGHPLLTVLLVCLAFSAIDAGKCSAGGFALYQNGARGNSLEGTLVARADDPSALFYNPAGITQLSGLQVMAGATAIMPSLEIVTVHNGRSTTTPLEDNVWIPPHFYATYQWLDSVWLGLGAFTQFGLGTEYDESWPGRYETYKSIVRSLTINPNVAVKLNERVSLAAGAQIIWFDLLLKQKIDPLGRFDPDVSGFDVDQALSGDSYGYGFNVALHLKPLDRVAVGISYRSKVKQSIAGEVDFTKPEALAAFPFFNDTKASGMIILPDMLFTGLMYKPTERLSIEVGATLTRWSSYKEFAGWLKEDPFFGTGKPFEIRIAKNWHDAWRYQGGIEYRAADFLDLRIGYVYDETPDPAGTISYSTPVNDCHAISFGPGLHWDDWTVDLSYTYVRGFDRDVKARPEHHILESEIRNMDEHLIGMSVAYRF